MLLPALVLDLPAKQKLEGTIRDAETGEALIGAAVMIGGTTDGAVTDVDGNFTIDYGDGAVRLVFTYIGYKELAVELGPEEGLVSVLTENSVPGQFIYEKKRITVSLFPDNELLANSVVTGRKRLESLQALRNERITSGFAIENMGAGEMSLKGISNAEESVTKMTGISVADAGQLIVRGLGDRYSTTTLNGLPIASPNPDNKLIPLDIFPASTIRNITVSKVYEASSYADYSGAHVDISTREGKSGDLFSVSVATGGYIPTFRYGLRTMDTPSLFVTPKLDKGAAGVPYKDFASYSRNNEIFKTSFSTKETAVLPDMSANIGYGKTISFGSDALRLLATVNIKSADESFRDAFYNTYEASSDGALRSRYVYDSYTRKLNYAGLLNIRYDFRESDNIGFTAFYARNAKNTHLDRTGYDYFESYDLTGRNQVSHYYRLQNYQLSGHHGIGASWSLDWGVSASLTSSDEPDRRQVMFRRFDEGRVGFFVLNQQETQRYYSNLDENEIVADIKTTYDFDDKGNRLRMGLSGKYKVRAFETTVFYYNLKSLDGDVSDFDDVDKWINYENISSGLISIDRKKNKRDKYAADNAIGAVFVETDLNFGAGWHLNAGLRGEYGSQSVDYNDDVVDKTRKLNSFDLFPAVNLRYDITKEHILRLSLSRTVTRPSFVEMAPFLYQESFGGAQIRGNEYLENGYNYNVDLKYEYFRSDSDDMVAVTGYFKHLDSPIERTQRLTGGALEHSFQNAENGLAAGLEVELKKKIADRLFFTANASMMYTNVTLPEGGAYTNMQRALQGASPYLVNADISYSPEFRNGSSLSLVLLYNLQGPRIQSVGLLGLGDVKQRPFHSLDFNCTYKINGNLSLNLSFRNLLDSSVRLVQDIPNAGRTVDVETWGLGRGIELGLKYNIL